MNRTDIEELQEGDQVKSTYSVKYKKPVKSYKKGYMFTLGLADRSGEIEAKYWGGKNEEKVEKVQSKISSGNVLEVKGKASEFQGNIQINIEEDGLRKVEEYDIEEFIEKADRDLDEMFSELKIKFEGIRNEDLERLMQAFFVDDDFVEEFKRAPAAMFYHHDYIGGLMEHVLHMIELGEKLCEQHESLDLDLIKVGCFLHDIGKMEEFEVTTNIKQSRGGLLSGHVTLGQEIILKKVRELENFPENLKHKLLHIVVSHHGKNEYGAVKEPMFPEALAIHYLDELDSQTVQMIDLKENADTEDFHKWTGKNRFGQIYLE
ncbi:MAG: 3'-5' exoribonuclease YhaM family protein [Candidatus Aenigmatarchaeota archaeon]